MAFLAGTIDYSLPDSELERIFVELNITPNSALNSSHRHRHSSRCARRVTPGQHCSSCDADQSQVVNEAEDRRPWTSVCGNSGEGGRSVSFVPHCPVCLKAKYPLLCPACVAQKTQRVGEGLTQARSAYETKQKNVISRMEERAPFLRRHHEIQRKNQEVTALQQSLEDARRLLKEELEALAALKNERKRREQNMATLRSQRTRQQKSTDSLNVSLQAMRSKLDGNVSMKLKERRKKFLLDWADMFLPTGFVPASELNWPMAGQSLCSESGATSEMFLSARACIASVKVASSSQLSQSPADAPTAIAVGSGTEADGEKEDSEEEEDSFCSIAGIPMLRADAVWGLVVAERFDRTSPSGRPSDCSPMSVLTNAPVLMLATKASLSTLSLGLSVLSNVLHLPLQLPASARIGSPAFQAESSLCSPVHEVMVTVDACVFALCSQQLNYRDDGSDSDASSGDEADASDLLEDSPLFNLDMCLSERNPNLGHSGPFSVHDSLQLPIPESSDSLGEKGYVAIHAPPPVVLDENQEGMAEIGQDWVDMGEADVPLVPEEPITPTDPGLMARSFSYISNLRLF